METSRDQLAEALYQKGLALAEIETLEVRVVISIHSNFLLVFLASSVYLFT